MQNFTCVCCHLSAPDFFFVLPSFSTNLNSEIFFFWVILILTTELGLTPLPLTRRVLSGRYFLNIQSSDTAYLTPEPCIWSTYTHTHAGRLTQHSRSQTHTHFYGCVTMGEVCWALSIKVPRHRSLAQMEASFYHILPLCLTHWPG